MLSVMWDVSGMWDGLQAPLLLRPSSEAGALAASAVVPAAVAREQDPGLQQRGIPTDRQQLLPGWGWRVAFLMHKDVTNCALPSVSQRPRVCVPVN